MKLWVLLLLACLMGLSSLNVGASELERRYGVTDAEMEYMNAAREGDFERFKSFFEGDVGPNYRSGESISPFAVSVINNRKAFFDWLLEEGADPDQLLDGRLPFVHLVYRKLGPDSAVRAIKEGVDLNVNVYRGRYTLFSAMAKESSYEFIEFMLKSGADPNILPPRGYSPLYTVYRYNEECGCECLELLIRHGADPSDPIRTGRERFIDVLESEGMCDGYSQ